MLPVNWPPTRPPAESGSSLKRNMLLLRHYWHRVGGTALAWFVWDFAFYGGSRTVLAHRTVLLARY